MGPPPLPVAPKKRKQQSLEDRKQAARAAREALKADQLVADLIPMLRGDADEEDSTENDNAEAKIAHALKVIVPWAKRRGLTLR
jgi:hypothetical protein